MARYRMLILSRPTPGQDGRFNQWYDGVHLGQMLQLPGFAAAQRFRLVRTLGDREAQPYAAIYDIETDDLDATMDALYREARSGQLLVDEALERGSIFAAVYEELGPARVD
jgi:hypothetical protein